MPPPGRRRPAAPASASKEGLQHEIEQQGTVQTVWGEQQSSKRKKRLRSGQASRGAAGLCQHAEALLLQELGGRGHLPVEFRV
jgi:hypothetical protein